MIMEVNLADAHKWLLRLKARTKLSNTALGDIIGYSDVGFAKAVRNNTLSIEQIELIAEKTDSIIDFNSNFSNNEETTPYKVKDGRLDELAINVNENWDALKLHPLLKTRIELDAANIALRKLSASYDDKLEMLINLIQKNK